MTTLFPAVSGLLLSSSDTEFQLVWLTSELDIDSVELNQCIRVKRVNVNKP